MSKMTSKKALRFTVAGAAYTLCYSTNALVEFEKTSGLKATQIATLFGDGRGTDISFDRLRQVFWAGLTDAHEGITERIAGQIMDDLGMTEVGRLLGEALTLAFGMAPKPAPDHPRAAQIGAEDALGNAPGAAG